MAKKKIDELSVEKTARQMVTGTAALNLAVHIVRYMSGTDDVIEEEVAIAVLQGALIDRFKNLGFQEARERFGMIHEQGDRNDDDGAYDDAVVMARDWLRFNKDPSDDRGE